MIGGSLYSKRNSLIFQEPLKIIYDNYDKIYIYSINRPICERNQVFHFHHRAELGGIMPSYKYLIIGGGMTADAAVAGIREVDPHGSIGLISNENHPPYNRPPLSKGLWKGKPLEDIFRQSSKESADIHLGRKAEKLVPQNKQVIDDQGQSYDYERLLLATGGSPRKLPFGGDEIIYFRTLDDFQRLHSLMEQRSRFAVIGGGFIGSELASALASKGQEVVMLFPEDGIGSLLFPADLASFLNDYYREQGVDVMAGELVSNIVQQGNEFSINMKSGREITVDQVIAGIGILPNTSLIETAGIKVENGILVDEFLQTSQADIYAAGDVANIYNPFLEIRQRVEHEDNALTSGKAAGRNMAGSATPYKHLSTFYSDLFELGYEAVGELNPDLEIVSDWQEPFKKGVVYYLDGSRLRGILLWNIWDQIDAARKLITKPDPFTSESLKDLLLE
jgi:NADPH-dependent 2,4-dienoyl-CoA reductase/sulfur reductase-like enzyme